MKWFDFILTRLAIASLVVWVLVFIWWQYVFKNPQNVTANNQTTAEFVEIESPKKLTLLFAGDLMFDRDIRGHAERQGNDFIFAPIKETLDSADLVVINLEGPITSNASVSRHTTQTTPKHFIFTFPLSLAETLATNNIGVVNLGNNHGSNFGVTGVQETVTTLDQAGVQYFGYLNGTEDFLKTDLLVEREGIAIGLVNYNQFSNQTIDQVVESIKALRSQCDFLVVYTHWDNEYQLLPARPTVIAAHQFIEAGADLIIGSHPHVIQSNESYQDKEIYYSLGNFVFDQYFEPAVRSGLLVRVELEMRQDQPIQATYIEELVQLQPNGQTILAPTKTSSQSAKMK